MHSDNSFQPSGATSSAPKARASCNSASGLASAPTVKARAMAVSAASDPVASGSAASSAVQTVSNGC
ncbi:Uncharacterised protein [Mycobacteroides abscessus subsp. abscessus]|nr:Uncharacterised protein [Mycobacteroides abscessus subsp. bolletii]SKT08383.1 Uncharacterised protein [Mycobacteroides abscessus subsp. abscessus]